MAVNSEQLVMDLGFLWFPGHPTLFLCPPETPVVSGDLLLPVLENSTTILFWVM